MASGDKSRCVSVRGLERERAGAVCRDIAQIDEETNIGNNTQAGERTERDIAPGLHNQNSLHLYLI